MMLFWSNTSSTNVLNFKKHNNEKVIKSKSWDYSNVLSSYLFYIGIIKANINIDILAIILNK